MAESNGWQLGVELIAAGAAVLASLYAAKAAEAAAATAETANQELRQQRQARQDVRRQEYYRLLVMEPVYARTPEFVRLMSSLVKQGLAEVRARVADLEDGVGTTEGVENRTARLSREVEGAYYEFRSGILLGLSAYGVDALTEKLTRALNELEERLTIHVDEVLQSAAEEEVDPLLHAAVATMMSLVRANDPGLNLLVAMTPRDGGFFSRLTRKK